MNENLSGDQFAYHGQHRPGEPGIDDASAPFHRADQVMPDVTGPNGRRYYDFHQHDDPNRSTESFNQMRAAKNNPDAVVKVYRAVPKVEHGINRGDWVSTSRKYAELHAAQDDDPSHDWPVVEGTAKASELHGHGDDPNEWGYWGS